MQPNQGQFNCIVCGRSTWKRRVLKCMYRRCKAQCCSNDCRREHHQTVHINKNEDEQ